MTVYGFRHLTARLLLVTVAFAVLAFGCVSVWALSIVETAIFTLAAVWAARRLLSPFRLVWSWFYIPLAMVGAFAFVQAWAGWTPSTFLTVGEAWKWLAYLLFFALSVNVFEDEWIRRESTTALVWFGFAVAVFGLFQYYHSPDAIYWIFPAPGAEIFGPFADRNHFAVLMELIFPAGMVLAMRAKEKKLIYYVACGLILAAVMVSASRAGAVVITVELVILVAAGVLWRGDSRRSRTKAAIQAAALGAVAIAFMLAAGTERVLERFEETKFQRGMTRVRVAEATWHKALERPWTGHGLGTFQTLFRSFAPFDDGFEWPHAHNDPVEFVFELGIVGAVLQISIFGLLIMKRRPRDVWLGNVLPLAGAWAHSLTEFPFQMPSLMLVSLLLLAQVPAGKKSSSRQRRSLQPSTAPTAPEMAKVA